MLSPVEIGVEPAVRCAAMTMNSATNMTTSPRTGRRSVLRLVVAGVVTLLAGLVAAVFWIVGQAQYFNEYCTMHSRNQPEPLSSLSPEAGMGGRPAYMDGPITVVCEYDCHPTVREIAPGWFIIALILAAVVVGIGVGTFRWAWRPKPSKRPAPPTEEAGTEPA